MHSLDLTPYLDSLERLRAQLTRPAPLPRDIAAQLDPPQPSPALLNVEQVAALALHRGIEALGSNCFSESCR